MSKSKQKPKTKSSKVNPNEKALPKTIGGKSLSKPMKAGLTAVANMVREGSKLSAIIKLLQRPEGATIDNLVKATGWQKHTVRSAVSHGLVKLRGYEIVKTKPKGELTIYKIVAPPKGDKNP